TLRRWRGRCRPRLPSRRLLFLRGPGSSEEPAKTELELARRQRGVELSEARIAHGHRGRIRSRRTAEELAAVHRLHVEVLPVRQVEGFGDGLDAVAGQAEALRQAQRELLERRPVFRVAADAERTVGVLAVAV